MFDLSLIPGALLAGFLMFLAPCTLPIVPGYLAFIAGGKDRIMRNAFAFVLGFSIVFILLGAFAGLIGSVIGPWRTVIAQFAGFMLILFGLTMLGVRIPFLSGERHIAISPFMVGRVGSSFLIGALFALGWSPCIGPILGTILLLASQSATSLEGALLLGVFSIGMGIPFLLTAYFIDSAGPFLNRIARFSGSFSYIGGVMLIFFGFIILMGWMGIFVTWGLSFFEGVYDGLLPYM